MLKDISSFTSSPKKTNKQSIIAEREQFQRLIPFFHKSLPYRLIKSTKGQIISIIIEKGIPTRIIHHKTEDNTGCSMLFATSAVCLLKWSILSAGMRIPCFKISKNAVRSPQNTFCRIAESTETNKRKKVIHATYPDSRSFLARYSAWSFPRSFSYRCMADFSTKERNTFLSFSSFCRSFSALSIILLYSMILLSAVSSRLCMSFSFCSNSRPSCWH